MTVSAEEFIRRFLQHSLPPVSSASATSVSWPTAIGLTSWSSAANCWPLPAPSCCPSRPLAATIMRRSSPAIRGYAPGAASASSSPSRPCGPAMVRFLSAWTVHDARAPKLATTQLCYPGRAHYPSVQRTPPADPAPTAKPSVSRPPLLRCATSDHRLPQFHRLHTKTAAHVFANTATSGPTPEQNPLKNRHHPAV